MNQKNQNYSLLWGSFNLFLAIGFGAFGAHGIKNMVSAKILEVYNTAVDYHFYIAFSFLILAFTSKVFLIEIKKSFYFLIMALFLFTGNLYLYVFTEVKFFAMIVPIGGISFMLAYLFLSIAGLKANKKSKLS